MKTETGKQILRLLRNFGSSAANVDADILRTLTEIADEYPTTLVSRVVDKFIRGEVQGQSLEFPPKPPMFSKTLRDQQELANWRPALPGEYQRMYAEQMQRLVAQESHEPTPEGKAKVAKLLAAFRQQTQINRDAERRRPAPEPMTAAKSEYWRKIMALKDAKEVTEEHRANRRRVQSEMGASA